jgi:AcrR family transcriptional regulator
MVTNNIKQKKRGRPTGRSEKGWQSQALIYATAIRLFSEEGFEQTTLRHIAREAGVSPALLYKYYPSKVAVVLELYDRLSKDFEARTQEMPEGTWRNRIFFVIHHSLDSLRAHRKAMKVLMAVMMSDPDYGLFSEATAFSRLRVHGQFERAISGAQDRPNADLAKAMSHLFYVLHLGLITWWLMDRSENQKATEGIMALLESLGRPLTMLIRVPGAKSLLLRAELLVREGLYGEQVSEV